MGIRYYAYPVGPDALDSAAADPLSVIGDDPLADAWGLVQIGPFTWANDAKPVPDMLYLDKCWRLLQRLTHPAERPPRPAHELFAGDVIPCPGYGYQQFVRYLSPEEVGRIAKDLAMIGDGDVDALFERHDFCARPDDPDYLREYLHKAKAFATRMRNVGYGIAYCIG